MAVRIRRFTIGKGSNLDPINRFYLEDGIRSADVLHVNISELGRDRVEYVITYEDSSSPRIIATFPTDGQRGVAPGTTVLAIFSESIQALSSGDIEIFNITDMVTVPSIDYTIDNSLVGERRGVVQIIDSGGYLLNQKTYRITFKTSIQDVSGNNMEEPYDLIFTASTSLAELDFDGDSILAPAFANPSLNRWDVIITPARLSITDDTVFQLTMRADAGDETAGFNPKVERTGASFKIVLEHDFVNQMPEPTAVLPTGLSVDWLAANGLG